MKLRFWFRMWLTPRFRLGPVRARRGETMVYDQKIVGALAIYRAVAFYRKGPDARIVVLRNGVVLQETTTYPAYRIWNIAAHLYDLAENHERKLAKENP